MSLQLQEFRNRSVIQLEDSITLNCASELRDLLLQVLNSKNQIEIDVSRVTEFDLSALQILYAARLAANQTGAGLSTASPVPEVVRAAIQESGIELIFESPSQEAR